MDGKLRNSRHMKTRQFNVDRRNTGTFVLCLYKLHCANRVPLGLESPVFALQTFKLVSSAPR